MHLYEHKKYVFRNAKFCGEILSGSKNLPKMRSWAGFDIQYAGYGRARFFCG